MGDFRVYKKKSAMSANLLPAQADEKGIVRPNDQGVIFLSAAKANPQKPGDRNRSFDWENKLTIALGPQDIVAFMDSTDGEVSLYHQSPRGGSATLSINKADTGSGYFLSIGRKSQEENVRNVSVFLSRGEYRILRHLLLDSFADIIGWYL